ncbi:MAG: hypothetical protein ACR2KV_13770, partial [Solirubrobacteraceae bacterium]
MGKRAKRASIALVAVSAVAVGSAGLADAASKVKHKRVYPSAAANTAAGGGETVLSGATLQSASGAATTAVLGGTVDRVSTENTSDPSVAAYEVHVGKTDGNVVVVEDSSFKVVSVTAARRGDRDHGRPGGGNANETVLAGATLTAAADAASAAVAGGRVTRASTEDKSDQSGATLAALLVHATSLLGDGYLHLSVLDVTVPFASGYRTFWMSIGIVAGWSLILLGLSFYARARIGQARWRSLHRFTALAWILGVAHSLGEGTDAGDTWFLAMTAVAVMAALALLAWRMAPRASAPAVARPGARGCR